MIKWLVAIGVIWVIWRYWRPAPKTAPRAARLSGAERAALTMLDVAAGADARAIREAHRRKIAEVHPDRGGSTELTRELNAARDLLLKAHSPG